MEIVESRTWMSASARTAPGNRNDSDRDRRRALMIADRPVDSVAAKGVTIQGEQPDTRTGERVVTATGSIPHEDLRFDADSIKPVMLASSEMRVRRRLESRMYVGSAGATHQLVTCHPDSFQRRVPSPRWFVPRGVRRPTLVNRTRLSADDEACARAHEAAY